MGFFRNLFGVAKLDGLALAESPHKGDYAQIDLLARFAAPRDLDDERIRARWNRVLPRSYDASIAMLVKQGWLRESDGLYVLTDTALPFVDAYNDRLQRGKDRAMAKVRQAIEVGDCGEALDIRRQYEQSHPLGVADWTGPEPQLSRSSLTRRILFLQHWLTDGLSTETADWLKLYAAEQHLWEAYWRLNPEQVPISVKDELASADMEPAEAVYWRAYQLALVVDNQETWQRCKGGDHVRRILLAGPDDEYTCEHCSAYLGEQYLVARVPELPHRSCSSTRGCRCRYEPVLESYDDTSA